MTRLRFAPFVPATATPSGLPELLRLLRAIEKPGGPSGTHGELVDRFGPELVAALESMRVFVEDDIAKDVPCRDFGRDCRHVILSQSSDGETFLAFPEMPGGCAVPYDITKDEAMCWIFDGHAFARLLQAAFGLSGSITRLPDEGGRAYRLGNDESGREVWLCYCLDADFALRYGTRQEKQQSPTLFLVPCETPRTPRGMADGPFQSDHVSVRFLNTLLEFKDGALRVRPGVTLAPATERNRPPATAFCELISHEGRRWLSREEYDAFIEAAPSTLDLILDLSQTIKTQKYRGGRRTLSGAFEWNELSESGALAVGEIVESGKRMQVTRLQPIQDLMHPEKAIQAVRKLLDVSAQRTKWRSFRRYTGNASGLEFAFEPPPTLRWALLKPASTT